MDVSIIIVNYNTLQMTMNCINSIFAMTDGVTFEVILIDNASSDGSKEVFENDKRIKYIYSYENLGFGRANNIGMILARGRYFFLLNSDTILLNNAVYNFFKYAGSQNKLSFYGAWLKDRELNYTHSAADLPSFGVIFKQLCKFYLYKFLRRKLDKSIGTLYSDVDECLVGYITGADLFFSRLIYEKIGGFDSQFFMYFEETDWQKRAKNHGIESFIIHGPEIIHFEGESFNKQNNTTRHPNVSKNAIKLHSQFLYLKKHNSWIKYIFLKFVYSILYIPVLLFAKSVKNSEIIPCLKVLFF